MLGEMWNFIKMGLKKRVLLGLIVVTSYSFFISLPNIFAKLVALSGFVAASGLYIAVFAQQFLPGIRFAFDRSKEYLIPTPIEIAELSETIGATIKEVKVRDKMNNAFVRGKTLSFRS